jgi:hypothetical protein
MSKEQEMDKEGISKELEAIELGEDEDEDIEFEKLLTRDLDPDPEDEDEAGADTSDKKVADSPEGNDKESKEEPEEDVDALKEQITKLEREAKGRLSDVVKSRQERSALKAELNELKTAVSSLLEKRNNASGEDEEPKKSPLEETKRPLEFGEDDTAYVDLSEVKEAIAAETAKTNKELDELKRERELQKIKETYEQNVQKIISEDKEILEPAYKQLTDIFNEFNDKIIEIQQRTGETGKDGTLELEQALELFSGSPEEEEFQKQHPGIDPTRIVRAFNSKVDFRIGLRHIADVKEIGKIIDDASKEESVIPDLDDKIKAAKNKPGSLVGNENQSGAASGLIERIGQLSSQDLLNMSDAEAAKIEAMLLREELKGE